MSLHRDEVHYFGAGPAKLPTEVLDQAALDLCNYENINLGVGEISHRSKSATKIVDDTKANFKQLMNIPDTHEVFFTQGGGTTAFSATAYNLMANYAKKTGRKGKCAYAVTGYWSKKAAEEAQRLGFDVDIVTDGKNTKYASIAPYTAWKPIDAANTAYLYVCDNETVHGNEFSDVPGPDYLPAGVELVADTSSNILSKKVDISKYGLLVAGAQKNVGLAGLTIYIIKKSLLEQASDSELRALNVPLCPIAFSFPLLVANNSTYNTMPVFTCHVLKLVTQKLLADGGVEAMEAENEYKARILYRALQKYPAMYRLPVDTGSQSRMNVVFLLPSEELETAFLEGAAERAMTGLKGHRSVGGMRASLYNAVSRESVERLAEFVDVFGKSH